MIPLPYIFQVLYVLCFTWTRYQVSVYRTIGPLISVFQLSLVRCGGSQSIRTQVNSYSFWSIRTQKFGQFVLIWSIRTHVWSVRTHFGQFVIILVNSYSNSNEYELTKMSTNLPKINFSYGITELVLISVSI